MLNDFIVFVKDVFPSIDPQKFDQVKASLKDFDMVKIRWFRNEIIDNLAQGDILDNFPVSFYDSNGLQITHLTKVTILSNSCDIENDENIIVAPLYKIDTISKSNFGLQSSIKNNLAYGKMCFVNSNLEDWFVDFSLANTFNKSILLKLIDEEKVKREFSLNDFGYYFLLVKLTIFFLRFEDINLCNTRSS